MKNLEERCTTFAGRCITEAYDPEYVHKVIHETYRLLLHAALQSDQDTTEIESDVQNIRGEYVSVVNTLPCLLDAQIQPQELRGYEEGKCNLSQWSDAINKAFQNIAGASEEGIDLLYDPRTVFNNLRVYLKNYQEFNHLNRVVSTVQKFGVKYLGNNLTELDDEAKKERIARWHSTLPIELGSICSEGDLSDVMYLGSKAMADAFLTYFNHACLSGSLGEASLLLGGVVPAEEFVGLNTDHFYSLFRISQRVLVKYLFAQAREKKLRTTDPQFWESAKDGIAQSKIRIDATNKNKQISPLLDMLHREMMVYVQELSEIDYSVLNSDIVPFVSQLDAVRLLRTDKGAGVGGRAIFSDEMGAGKTLSAILADALFRKEGAVRKTLVVCPNQMKHEWKKRFTKYVSDATIQAQYIDSDGELSIEVVNGSASLQKIEDHAVVIVNYEMLHRSVSFLQNAERSVMELARTALLNGVEELFKESETLEAVCTKADTIGKKLGKAVLTQVRKSFKGKRELLEWVDTDEKRAAYILAADELLQEEKKTTQSLFSYGADFLILDEAHAIKNPAAKRTKGLEELAKEIPRIALLTGTLIPNRYEDISIPLQLVDQEYQPERIVEGETAKTLAPKLRRIRSTLIPYLSRNLRDTVAPRSYAVTPEQERLLVVPSDEVMRAAYRSIIEDSTLTFSDKARLTRLAVLNPALAVDKLWQMAEWDEGRVDAESIVEKMMNWLPNGQWDALIDGEYVPPKYLKVAEEIRKGDGNAIVFTSHIEGNTRPLKTNLIPSQTLIQYLQKTLPDWQILLHDGATEDRHIAEQSERSQIIKTFNTEDKVVLVASYPTLGEGADLTKGTRVFCLDLPYSLPEQAVGRADRITQTKDVTVSYLAVTDKALSANTKSGLTIDEAVLQLGRDKKLVSSILVDGKPPGKEELEAYRNLLHASGDRPHAYTPLEGGLDIVDEAKDDNDRLRTFIRKVGRNNKGSKRNVQDFDERLRRVYIQNGVLDPSSYTCKSNTMMAQCLEAIAEGKQLADLGGGPASLALCGGLIAPYTVIDPAAWQASLEAVLQEKELSFPEQVAFVEGYLHETTPLWDVISCNNMLHWTGTRATKGKCSEREEVLRSVNEHLTESGLFVVGLPGVYTDSARENIGLLLHNNGFGEHSIDQVQTPEDTGFNQLLVIAKKTAEPNSTPLTTSQLNLKTSQGRTHKRLIGTKKKVSTKKKTGASLFYFGDKNVKDVLG